mmetsp:Transcript_10325/g.26492  ORF Transcript_10325/g.26492 Transcript_10325/m.26492 type:complete len:87 (-) Transcript_10325:79-339(-)
MASATTAGRYLGAYRVPATADVTAMLTAVRDGNYFDQELRDEAKLFLGADKVPYILIQKLCTAVREKEGVHGPWVHHLASFESGDQ